MRTTLQKVGTEAMYLNIIRAACDKSTANLILSGEKPKSISYKISNKIKMFTLTTIFNTIL